MARLVRAALLLLVLLVPSAGAEATVWMSPGPMPPRVEIDTYTAVAWRWAENETHEIVGEDGTVWCAANASRCERVFVEPGEHRYHCALHPDERGVIVVTRGAGDPGTPLRAIFEVVAVDGLHVTVDASPSAQSSTAIESFTWHWGDGTNATGRRATHAYAQPGEVRIVLVVVDEEGRRATGERRLLLARPDDEAARFEANVTGRVVTVEAGEAAEQTWDFGDGARLSCDASACRDADVGTLVHAPGSIVHVYRRGGTFEIARAVLGPDGAPQRATRVVEARADETFAVEARGLRVVADAGALGAYGNATYRWRFGDGTTAEGARVEHAFPAEGAWSVALDLSDDAGTWTLARDVPLPAPEDDLAPPPTRAPTPTLGLLATVLVLAALATLKSER